MKSILPEYTAVVRTLGTAGEKYQALLNSLISQTHPPKEIIVYLAEGYEKPKETVDIEKIVYVKKGMVAQRALKYKEVNTEWILFLDDDVAIEPWGMEKMMGDMIRAGADVCAFDAFPHHLMSLKDKLVIGILFTSFPRLFGKKKGYTVNLIGTDTYNLSPKVEYAWSTTNAGPAFIARKGDFLDIHFEEDLWLDESPYAIPEDRVMFYRMHLAGLKILTHYNSGFKHLDAKSSVLDVSERTRKIVYSSARNNYIFTFKYVYPNLVFTKKILFNILYGIKRINTMLFYCIQGLKGRSYKKDHYKGIKDAKRYLMKKK